MLCAKASKDCGGAAAGQPEGAQRRDWKRRAMIIMELHKKVQILSLSSLLKMTGSKVSGTVNKTKGVQMNKNTS